eukprot:scaffold135638_cov102-Phaeocystis_antarctica.AAC.1
MWLLSEAAILGARGRLVRAPSFLQEAGSQKPSLLPSAREGDETFRDTRAQSVILCHRVTDTHTAVRHVPRPPSRHHAAVATSTVRTSVSSIGKRPSSSSWCSPSGYAANSRRSAPTRPDRAAHWCGSMPVVLAMLAPCGYASSSARMTASLPEAHA